jgi:DNA-binding NtrC family response regulator
LLIAHFLESKSQALNLPLKKFSQEAMDLLLAYHWPGNVREMENTIERALILSGDRIELLPEDLNNKLQTSHGSQGLSMLVPEVLRVRRSLGEAVDLFERQVIERGLEVAGFNQTRAAEILGTTRRILKYKIDKLAIHNDALDSEDDEDPASPPALD